MRNLLGRLNARSAPALAQIADSWQTPLTGRDRLAQISQLYRTMTRMSMVRVFWDGLDPDQKSVVHALIKAGDAGRTIEQLSAELSANPEAIRTICVGLYEQGVIAYEGTASSLPLGEKPRLFVPLELGNALQRAAQELQEGNVIIFEHEGKEKIKRILEITEGGELYVEGEHAEASKDSRHFGAIHKSSVIGKVIWPSVKPRY